MFFIPAEQLGNYELFVSLIKTNQQTVEFYIDPAIWKEFCLRAAFWRFCPFGSFAGIVTDQSDLDDFGFPIEAPSYPYSGQAVVQQIYDEATEEWIAVLGFRSYSRI